MKVLLISHNVFCKNSNMGKTLSAYFADFGIENIAQFYVHSEVPNDDSVCTNYYRVTDGEVLRSILKRKSGKVFHKEDIDTTLNNTRTDTGATANIYQKSRKRTPFIYFARNLIWSVGKWNTKKLKEWVDKFSPEAVFLASGDYAFIYKIALKIAKRKNIPLYVSCMDDFYFHNRNENSLSGKVVYSCFMRQVRKTMKYASGIFAICDKMSEDYSKLFGVPCYTLHTGSEIEKPFESERKNKISYIGNLSYKRFEQIIDLGRALLKVEVKNKPEFIDLYTTEKRPEILKDLTKENGINFCGAIGPEEVKKVISESMLLVHTESFDEDTKKRVAYSVSTKIADSVSSGSCLLAYGPKGIASIDYLAKNNAAFCINSKEELVQKLEEIISNEALRQDIVKNQLELAKKNHRTNKNCELIKRVIFK